MSRYNVSYQLANATNTEALIAGENSGKGPSKSLWSGCPWLALQHGAKEGFVYWDDFMGPIDPTIDCGWALDTTNSGSIDECDDEQGGVVEFSSNGHGTIDDGLNAQLKNCMFKPAAGRKIWFEARVKMNDATDQYFLGLAGVCTALISDGALEASVDKCGFYHEAVSTDDYISAVSSRLTSTEKNTNVGANANTVYVKLGFLIDGLTSVTYFRNGVPVAVCNDANDIPNAVMCLSAVAQIEATGANAEMSWDWVKIAQEGGRN